MLNYSRFFSDSQKPTKHSYRHRTSTNAFHTYNYINSDLNLKTPLKTPHRGMPHRERASDPNDRSQVIDRVAIQVWIAGEPNDRSLSEPPLAIQWRSASDPIVAAATPLRPTGDRLANRGEGVPSDGQTRMRSDRCRGESV